MVSETVSFTEPRFGPGQTVVCMFVACFRRTFHVWRPTVGRGLYWSSRSRPCRHELAITVFCGSVFVFTDFFPVQWRGVNISSIVSFNSYPCGVYVIQIWGFFLYCHFIISNTLDQFLSRHFRLLWTLLQWAHPLDLFLALMHCLPRKLIFSGVHYYLLEPSTLFSFSDCITRFVSHPSFGRLVVYCILHTPAVSWEGLGCPFRFLLYLFSIQSVWWGVVLILGELWFVHCDLSYFEYFEFDFWTSLECDLNFLLICVCSPCKNGQSVVVYHVQELESERTVIWCTGEADTGSGVCTCLGIANITINIISCSVSTTVLGDSKTEFHCL